MKYTHLYSFYSTPVFVYVDNFCVPQSSHKWLLSLVTRLGGSQGQVQDEAVWYVNKSSNDVTYKYISYAFTEMGTEQVR